MSDVRTLEVGLGASRNTARYGKGGSLQWAADQRQDAGTARTHADGSGRRTVARCHRDGTPAHRNSPCHEREYAEHNADAAGWQCAKPVECSFGSMTSPRSCDVATLALPIPHGAPLDSTAYSRW